MIENFSQVTGTAKFLKSSDFIPLETQGSLFLLLKAFVSIRVHFPQDSFRCQTDLCATLRDCTHVFQVEFWFSSYSVILEISLINSNYLLKCRHKYLWFFRCCSCCLFSPLRSAEPVLLCVFSVTNMNWSVNEDASAVPDVGCTQLLASLPLYILKLWFLRRWRWMRCVMYYLPLVPVHQTVWRVWL